MKSKSFIVALLTVSTLGLTTSCADMFDIDSTRVVYEKDHNLDSTSDSVYTTLGVLQCMQQIADRYVILGEVRGDLCDINDGAKTSLRNLANFNFEDDNEYLKASDYFAVINNCSYALAKLDTTLTQGNSRVMVDEYAALLGIRAWTYLQLAINYGDVPYYDFRELVTTEEGFDKVGKNRLNIQQLADALIPDLEGYVDYALPSFVSSISQNAFPILRLVIADLYLWSDNYLKAFEYYADYLFDNKAFNAKITKTSGETFTMNRTLKPAALLSWNGKTDKSSVVSMLSNEVYGNQNVAASGYENLAYIKMETNESHGVVSELGTLFYSRDNTHYLKPSVYWKELSARQVVFSADKDGNGSLKNLNVSTTVGDMRAAKLDDLYLSTGTDEKENSYDSYNKFRLVYKDGKKSETDLTPRINIYRRSIVYLRLAEALNSLAAQLDLEARNGRVGADSLSRVAAKNAFYILKDASKAELIAPTADSATLVKFKNEIQTEFVGIHARGAGDVAYDTTYYVLKPEVIRTRLAKGAEEELRLSDTIRYVDELIIDELALESTLEGNRFGDLIRFAKRYGEPDILAKRVASRGGKDNINNELYNKLLEEANWYLPMK